MILLRWFSAWWSWLVTVRPEAVIGWHYRGFWFFWRRNSGGGDLALPTPRHGIALTGLVRRLRQSLSAGYNGHYQILQPGPEVGQQVGVIACRERLGGLLKYYHREAA
jgi:hypothetical protein